MTSHPSTALPPLRLNTGGASVVARFAWGSRCRQNRGSRRPRRPEAEGSCWCPSMSNSSERPSCARSTCPPRHPALSSRRCARTSSWKRSRSRRSGFNFDAERRTEGRNVPSRHVKARAISFCIRDRTRAGSDVGGRVGVAEDPGVAALPSPPSFPALAGTSRTHSPGAISATETAEQLLIVIHMTSQQLRHSGDGPNVLSLFPSGGLWRCWPLIRGRPSAS